MTSKETLVEESGSSLDRGEAASSVPPWSSVRPVAEARHHLMLAPPSNSAWSASAASVYWPSVRAGEDVDGLGDVGVLVGIGVVEDDIFGRVEADVVEREGVAEGVANLGHASWGNGAPHPAGLFPFRSSTAFAGVANCGGVLVELGRDAVRVVGVAART